MTEPVPSRRPRAGDTSLATVASPTTQENIFGAEIPDGSFPAHCHKLKNVYANGRAVKQLSQPIRHPLHA